MISEGKKRGQESLFIWKDALRECPRPSFILHMPLPRLYGARSGQAMPDGGSSGSSGHRIETRLIVSNEARQAPFNPSIRFDPAIELHQGVFLMVYSSLPPPDWRVPFDHIDPTHLLLAA